MWRFAFTLLVVLVRFFLTLCPGKILSTEVLLQELYDTQDNMELLSLVFPFVSIVIFTLGEKFQELHFIPMQEVTPIQVPGM